MLLILLFVVLVIVISVIITALRMMINDDPLITNTLLQCPLSYCATNITTGVKRCSEFDSDRVIYDPATETCNPIGLCTDAKTPYAETGDGTTSSVGQCDTNTTPCRCLSSQKCANYFSNHFEYSLVSSTGSSEISGTNIRIAPGNMGDAVDKDIFSCTVPGVSLGSVINAPFCYDLTNIDPVIQNENYNNCIRRNPCPDGLMAVLVDDYDSAAAFTMDSIAWNTAPLGCINGYPTDNNGIVQRAIYSSGPSPELLTPGCELIRPSLSWWNAHCQISGSGYPANDDFWKTVIDMNLWSIYCTVNPANLWHPIFDKSTHTLYCKNS